MHQFHRANSTFGGAGDFETHIQLLYVIGEPSHFISIDRLFIQTIF